MLDLNHPRSKYVLEALSKAVDLPDYKKAWEHLIELEGNPGKDNFGVWAI